MTQTTNGYAEALFALGMETDSVDLFRTALADVKAVFDANPDYVEFLACYGIPAKERTDALAQAFSDTLPEYVLSLLQLLCENGHIKLFFNCVKTYEALYLEARSTTTVKVTSAVPLRADERARLEGTLVKLCRRKIVPIYTVDASILGGVIVEADGKVLDGSVKNRLHELKEVIDE